MWGMQCLMKVKGIPKMAQVHALGQCQLLLLTQYS